MSGRHWVLAGGALFTIIVVALLIYGRSTHTEPTLLHVCWYQGHAIYKTPIEGAEQRGPCTRFDPLVWPQDQIPITVSARSHMGQALDEVESDAFRSAVAAINRRLGFEQFRLVDASQAASVQAVLGVPVEVGAGTESGLERGNNDRGNWANHSSTLRRARDFCVHQRRDSGYLRADLLARSGGSHDYLFRLYYHALSHCIGLAHDTFESSPMHPKIVEEAWRPGYKIRFFDLTDADRAKLRELYFSR